MKDILRHHTSMTATSAFSKFKDRDKKLGNVFCDTRVAVHEALCGKLKHLLSLSMCVFEGEGV